MASSNGYYSSSRNPPLGLQQQHQQPLQHQQQNQQQHHHLPSDHPPQQQQQHHTKSSVFLKSIIHRRQHSDGSALTSARPVENPQINAFAISNHGNIGKDNKHHGGGGGGGGASSLGNHNSGALSELQQNLQDNTPRSPRKSRDDGARFWQQQPQQSQQQQQQLQQQQQPQPQPQQPPQRRRRFDVTDRSRSPTKNALLSLTKSRESSPTKKSKESKSGTTVLSDLLSRPKSLKNLHKLWTDDEARSSKDKENRTPDDGKTGPLPIYAQFVQGQSMSPGGAGDGITASPSSSIGKGSSDSHSRLSKQRPKSFMFPSKSQPDVKSDIATRKAQLASRGLKTSDGKSSQEPTQSPTQRSKHFSAFASFGHGRSKSSAAPSASTTTTTTTTAKPTTTTTTTTTTTAPSTPKSRSIASASSTELICDPKDIDKQLEALLDRRNIPENQRYKMRNLTDTIKMEFIRQDWAEMQAAKLEQQPASKGGSMNSNDGSSAAPAAATNRASTSASMSASASAAVSDAEVDEKPKRSRGRSFTFSRAKKENNNNNNRSTSKKREGTLGRHLRSKSSDSVVSERPVSSGSSPGSGLFAKIKPGQRPDDYVSYLRKVQKPELVEVGKLHKLRLLLRNETVAWIEDFIQQGGMKEIVGLLNRLMEVEWREEHEDALLHENLLCLKALCTTAKAIEYLHSVQADLFPRLLHMLFDPEKKGPSEFTTRNIVTSVLFTYIESAQPAERVSRAKTVLRHLRDPEPEESSRPLPFVMEMRRDRPYRVWCKEVVNVTKEVFWIFLHNLNVISAQAQAQHAQSDADAATKMLEGEPQYLFMRRHFPLEKPPVAAAPYVGGVEWDATNYLASHLDLLNAILACTASRQERNELREQFRISGWERCLGGSLRLCKEKFYANVHTGLRTWVAAAADDEWDVRDVRYGPPVEPRSPTKTIGGGGVGVGNAGGGGGGGGQRKKVEEPPKLDMPKLDFGLEPAPPRKDAWLS